MFYKCYIYFIYISRNRVYLNSEHFKAITNKTERIEEEISKHELEKRSKCLKKWRLFIADIV